MLQQHTDTRIERVSVWSRTSQWEQMGFDVRKLELRSMLQCGREHNTDPPQSSHPQMSTLTPTCGGLDHGPKIYANLEAQNVPLFGVRVFVRITKDLKRSSSQIRMGPQFRVPYKRQNGGGRHVHRRPREDWHKLRTPGVPAAGGRMGGFFPGASGGSTVQPTSWFQILASRTQRE